MSRSLLFLKLIGVVCLVYVLVTLDITRLWDAIESVDGRYLAAACGVNLAAAAIKAWRWKVLVAAQSGSISFARCFFAHVYLTFVASITPGRIGDLFKWKYVRETGFGSVKAATNLLLDRSSDLVMMGSLGLAAALFQTGTRLELRLLVGIAVLLAGSMLLIRVLYAPLLERLNERSRTLVEGVVFEARDLDLAHLTGSIVLTIAGILAIQLQMYLIALGLGIEMSFGSFLPIILAANLVALLPISISGLGTRELVLITLLGRHGVSPEAAALVSFIDVFLISFGFRGALSLIVGVFKKRLLPEVAPRP